MNSEENLYFNEEELLEAISKSYYNYIKYGPRSTEKLKPIHRYIARTLEKIFGSEYKIHYMDDNNKEMVVEGKYYEKVIDITVTKKDDTEKPVLCLGIKFVTSNYKQNANNYFENMMGETANIQATKDIPYFQLIILRHETPYYEKTTQEKGKKIPKKIEIINQKDLSKYVKLIYDNYQPHRPYAIGIFLITLDEDNFEAKRVKVEDQFNKSFAELLLNKLSVENFFYEIKNYKNYYENKS